MSTFGNYFKIMTFGESHGNAVGCVIEGCAPNIPLTEYNIQIFLDRRKPGQNDLSSPRQEADLCEILSGTFEGKTIGSPICVLVKNKNQRQNDYDDIQKIYRPGHADYTYSQKYQLHKSPSGGGRASARETIGRVAAGAVAKAFVQSILPSVNIISKISRVHHATDEQSMKNTILNSKAQGDTVGGTIHTSINHVPAGLGEPVFDKFEAQLAKAMMSLPAAKFFESGDGYQATYKYGSENNDSFFTDAQGKIRTKTNFSGGIQGGISNGMPITFTVGFKPVSTIFKTQKTVSKKGENVLFAPESGRHDPCVLARAVVIVEAMSWLVLADMLKAHLALGIGNLKDIEHI